MTPAQQYLKAACEMGYRVEGMKVFSPRGEKKWRNRGDGTKYPVIEGPVINGKFSKNLKVHRIVAYQKFGDAMFEKGIVVRHLNGNPLDFSCDNIAIGTQKENFADMTQEDLIKRTAWRRKHSSDDVRNMRELYKNSHTLAFISKMYNANPGAVFWIVKGLSYKEVL
jgi:hypothetical protein